PIHTTPPNDDYVALASKSILDKLLEEFRDEILNVTMVDDEAEFNPTKDLEELERLLAKEPQSNFTEIQQLRRIMEMEPDIENMTLDECREYDAEKESIWEQDDDSEEDQEEDGDDRDTFDMWDITVEDVEQIRKSFNVPDEIDEIVQPLIPETIHTTPPNDDYVAQATKSILDELLEEFGDEILNVTMVDGEAEFNPTKDL
ncbi:hypothetical protein Tco_1319627, partial [Tanacetum coccineum]